ncbi:DUF4126 domain-containing protein [Actinoallomurus iriomotensis]|uniref:Membrane protein n=1 Tax=Actinoallomurus iriomotensis TaxID=478107 RepID=A0A9W6RKM2_9ACTN|nr:DUF4126 domain-containing protein [Actinoallomurus iriomotensis]GLY77234.1 membrane protein [Actinoallomurus iriomotensis]GLY89416.1 membrane protein [Actinoallomurus iriomotensis]
MFATLTGLGLSASAGLNAYIPILVVGLLARFTDAIALPHQFAWMSNGWALTAVVILLAAEVVLDKVAVVDHVNDAIQTFVRPAAGGAVFAASDAAAKVDHSAWMAGHPWVGWVLGIVVALCVHLTKAGARPVINAGTVGLGTPFVSAAEDAMSLGMSLIAVLVPALVILVLIVFALIGWRLIRRVRRWRRGRRSPERIG